MPIHIRSKRRPAAPAVRASAPSVRPAGELPFGLPKPPPGPQRPEGISLCMIVKNEERFMAQCLRSVHDAVDEMIVVDTGSTDRTIEIAKSFGATVIEREWRNDFAWARNQALEAATKRWILVLDADEELMPASKAALRQVRDVPAALTALWVRLYNRSDDYQGSGEMSHALIRVFPNDPKIRYRGLIHEFPTVDGDPNGLRGVASPIGIVHHGYVKEIVTEKDKGARNLAIVRAATEQEPDDPYNWFNLGTTAFLVDDFETARSALERMREMLGDAQRGFLPNGLAVLAETYCDKLGDPKKGEEVARHALRVSPHYANAHFQLGKALVAQERFDEAREAYEAAIADREFAALQYVIDDQVYIWKAHSEIGSSYVMQKNDEKALEWFEKGLANAPKAEPLMINRAKALERLGRFDQAAQGYAQVYELYRGHQATLEYVNFLLRQGRESDALKIIDESYSRLPADMAVPMLMAAAAVCQKHGSADDERYLTAAAALAPGSAQVLDPLEALLAARGRTAELAALIAREEETPPSAAADFTRRTRRAVNERRYEQARTLAEQGLALAPNDALLSYGLAYALVGLGNEDAAVDVLAAVREGTPDAMTAVLVLLATLHRNAGRFEAALAACEAVVALAPRNLEAALLRADLLKALGRDNEYERALMTAFELDPARVAVPLSSYYLEKQRFSEAAAIAGKALGA